MKYLMPLNRFKFGAFISCVWFGTMICVAVVDWPVARMMKPNEWGDFFAGFFAPLAFLWLVLGYMQQGEELQLSTQALLLQAEELKNSVEQQKELVEVTRQQLEGEREALHLERIARQDAAKPLFVIRNSGGSFSGAESNFDISIANAGNTVTQVVGVLEGAGLPSLKLFDHQMFARSSGASARLSIVIPFPDVPALLTISYLDSYGQPGRCAYSVTKQNSTANSMLDFEAVPLKN
jgi:hypothetical protein